MGWLIALAILAALAALPLGVRVRYDASGTVVEAKIGFLRIRLLPKKRKEKKAEEPKPENPGNTPEPAEKASAEEKPVQQPAVEDAEPAPEKKSGGSLTDFLPLLEVAKDLLSCLRRKLRVDVLTLQVVLAGEDKAALAKNYGLAWAALGNLYPRLERIFVIRKRNLEIECDFAGRETRVVFELVLTITLGRILAIAVVYGIRGLRTFLKIRKQQKGGAVT